MLKAVLTPDVDTNRVIIILFVLIIYLIINDYNHDNGGDKYHCYFCSRLSAAVSFLLFDNSSLILQLYKATFSSGW